MHIGIGSENETKYQAVASAIAEMGWLDVVCEKRKVRETKSITWDQKELIKRALGRAVEIYQEGDTYAIGIEEGFIKIPMTENRWYTTIVAGIIDGTSCTIGFGPGLLVPNYITECLGEGEELPRILQMENLTSAEKMPLTGLVGILSRTETERRKHMEIAIQMAFYPWRMRREYNLQERKK